MRRTALRTAWVVCALSVGAAAWRASAQEAEFGSITTIALDRGLHAEAATLADVDGDGATDLIVATSRRGRVASRRLEVRLRRSGASAFAAAPDHVFDLTADVVAFSAGDVAPDKGVEIVLFTATGAYAWRPLAPEEERPRKLVTAEFLWQLPHPRETFQWARGARDLTGDGLDDLLLPGPEGYVVAVQRRTDKGSTFDVSTLRLPDEDVGQVLETRSSARLRRRREGREFRVSLGLGTAPGLSRGDLIEVGESVPAPVFTDWDGDGDLDALVQTEDRLHVWLQQSGHFPELPDAGEPLPLDVDRGRRLDPSFGSHAAQLDTDGRADCVILAGDRRSEEARTQVLVYRHGDTLFGSEGVPSQALIVAGFVGAEQLVDVNGDGLPDLVLPSVEVDGIDALRAATSGTIDSRIAVFLGGKTSFSRRPDATITLPVDAKAFRRSDRLLARFFGDATGNGASDLLVRDGSGELQVLATLRSRTGLSLRAEPLWRTRIDDDADVTSEASGPGGAPELLVLEDGRVLHVRFR